MKYEYDPRKSLYDIDKIVFHSEMMVSKLNDNKYRIKVEDREMLLETLGIVVELRRGEAQ